MCTVMTVELKDQNMKLRIHKKSIRLRINRDDLNVIDSKGLLIHSLGNTNHKWSYRIILDEIFKMELNNDGFHFFIPKSDFKNLKNNQIDQLKYEIDNLSLCIEKEYACLHPSDDENENDSDSVLFPRPKKEER